MLLESIKELDMTYKKLLKKLKSIYEQELLITSLLVVHIAGINDNSQIPNASHAGLKTVHR